MEIPHEIESIIADYLDILSLLRYSITSHKSLKIATPLLDKRKSVCLNSVDYKIIYENIKEPIGNNITNIIKGVMKTDINHNFFKNDQNRIDKINKIIYLSNIDHVVVAGGAAATFIDKSRIKDIDLFIWGMKTNKEYRDKIKEIIKFVAPKNIIRSYFAMTMNEVQIILTNNISPQSIIDEFDFDAAKVYLNNGCVYCSPEFIRATKHKTIQFDTTKATIDTPYRLSKYVIKGYKVRIPDSKILSDWCVSPGWLRKTFRKKINISEYGDSMPENAKNYTCTADMFACESGIKFTCGKPKNIDTLLDGWQPKEPLLKMLDNPLVQRLLDCRYFENDGFNRTNYDLFLYCWKQMLYQEKLNWMYYKN